MVPRHGRSARGHPSGVPAVLRSQLLAFEGFADAILRRKHVMEGQALSVTVKVTEADLFQYLRDHGFYFWRVMLPVGVLFCIAAFGVLAVLQDVTSLYLTLAGGVMSTAAGVWWYRFYL